MGFIASYYLCTKIDAQVEPFSPLKSCFKPQGQCQWEGAMDSMLVACQGSV